MLAQYMELKQFRSVAMRMEVGQTLNKLENLIRAPRHYRLWSYYGLGANNQTLSIIIAPIDVGSAQSTDDAAQ